MAFFKSGRTERLNGCPRLIFFAMLVFSCVFATPFAIGEDASHATDTGEGTKEGDKTHFQADSLAADAESIELIGNGRMWVGDSFITADKIQIFFGETGKEKEEGADQEMSFDKAVASGSVRIRLGGENADPEKDPPEAEAERAEYTTANQVLILSGGKPVLRQGGSYLSGPEIILYRAEERIVINGGEDGRVEGEILQTGMKFD